MPLEHTGPAPAAPASDQIKELEAAIASARSELEKADARADQQYKADLEAQIGSKSAQLEHLLAQQQQQYASERDELEALRREKRDREIKEQAAAVAGQIQAGLKTAQEAEQQRVSQMIQAELSKVLGTSPSSAFDIKSVVHDALSEIRTGRKFVPDSGDGRQASGDSSSGEQTPGRKGGGAYAHVTMQGDGLGEADNFAGFCRAILRRDGETISRMQRKHGVTVGAKSHWQPYLGSGGKALVEGAGWTDTVAGPSGGYIVPVEYVNQIIPALYPFVTLFRAGVRRIPMTSPSLRQPILTGSASASYIGETAAIPASQQTFGQFSLLAKELVGLVPVSRTLLQDANPAVDQIVREDLARVMGLKMDVSLLTGAGGGTVPLGIFNASGITVIAAVGANGDAPTWDMVVGMLTAFKKSNIPRVRLGWVMPPDLQGAFARAKDNNGRPLFQDYMNPASAPGGVYPPQGDGENGPDGYLFSLPVYTSTQLPLGTTGTGATATLALIEFSQVAVGELGEMELDVSTEGTYRDGSNNIIPAWQDNLAIFRSIMRHDVAPLHPGAITLRNGVLYT